MHTGGQMSRFISMIGLVVFAGLGAAACHSGGPGGGDQMPDPMDPMNPMYRAPVTATACTSPSSAAKCSPVQSR
jgi:hypothetical protein